MTTQTTPEQAREIARQLIDRTLSGIDPHPVEALRSLADQVEALTAERDAHKLDAGRYQVLAAYLVGPRTDIDDQIIACETVDQLSAVIDVIKELLK